MGEQRKIYRLALASPTIQSREGNLFTGVIEMARPLVNLHTRPVQHMMGKWVDRDRILHDEQEPLGHSVEDNSPP